MSHTYVILPVSRATFEEIRTKLVEACYAHALHDDVEGELIDMHGLALQVESEPT